MNTEETGNHFASLRDIDDAGDGGGAVGGAAAGIVAAGVAAAKDAIRREVKLRCKTELADAAAAIGCAAAAAISATAATAAAILARLKTLSFWAHVRRPCVYLSTVNEAPTHALWADFHAREISVLAPRIAGDNGELALHAVAASDVGALVRGGFGILEPPATLPCVAPAVCDCILVPGVAFAPDGGRVGHGKGFYDRLLAQIPPQIPRVGIAFDWQIFPQVPLSPHDQRMSHIVTPTRIYAVGAGGTAASSASAAAAVAPASAAAPS
jgi:5-formyltetrahydrofolate cyclo-ligase